MCVVVAASAAMRERRRLTSEGAPSSRAPSAVVCTPLKPVGHRRLSAGVGQGSAKRRGRTSERDSTQARERAGGSTRGRERGVLHEVLVQAPPSVLELVERRARRAKARERRRERGRTGERRHKQEAARARQHEKERGAAGERARSLCLGFLSRRLLLFWGLLSTSGRRVLGVALVEGERRHVRALLGRLHRPRREHEAVEVQDDVWH